MIRALFCLIVLGTSSLAAQQSPFVGSWTLSYTAGATVENGTTTPILGTGTLTIVSHADTLIGELVMDPNPEIPSRPPLRLVANGGGRDATFVSHSEATLSINGNEQTATVISTWRLEVRGDSLLGTVERKLDGFEMEMGAKWPQPVTGVRRKG